MDLNLFNGSGKSDVKPSIQGTDAEKFQKIATILSTKRKAMEEKLQREGANAKDEERLELRNLIEEMRTFGISEIDYQKFLVMEGKK